MAIGSATSNSGIRDNHSHGIVADFLAEKISTDSVLSVVSAYFTIYAYEALAGELDQIESLRFLFGEPSFIATIDPDKTDKKRFKIEDEGLELANRLQQKEIARRCTAWIRDKVEIRSIRQANLLHGKLYHIHDGHREHAILGSSNFTRRGLGLSATPNIELNLIVDSDRDRADLKAWFDNIWADDKLVADVKDEVLRYLEQLYVNHAPEFIYFKTLFHVFERFLSGQADDAQLFDRTAITDSVIWKTLFDFQKDGAKGAIHKINAHNGCILADSVGLGKTYISALLAQQLPGKILIICPPVLQDYWHDTFFEFGIRGYKVESLGKLDHIIKSGTERFDYIFVDEAHRFRNEVTLGYEKLHQVCFGKKVILVSATPLNRVCV